MFDVKVNGKIFSKEVYDALRSNNNDLILSLLEKVDVLTLQDSHKITLLHASAASGNTTITEHLIRLGCNIEAKDEDGNTPLLVAVYFGHFHVVKVLIEAGGDLCVANSQARTPVFYAQLWNDGDIMNLLVSVFKGNRVNKSSILKWYLEAIWYKRNVFHKLINTVSYGERLLRLSAYGNGVGSQESKCELPLNRAIFLKDMHQIHMNLKYGADPLEEDAYKCTSLHVAATLTSRNNDIVHLLFKNGVTADIKNEMGMSPLHVASAFCNVDFMELMIKQGANVNAVDKQGRTPLYAVFTDPMRSTPSRKDAMHLLIKNGADITINPPGKNPILVSARNLGIHHSKFLLKHLAKLEANNELSVSKETLEVIRKCEKLQRFYNECKIEIECMKRCKAYGRISVFNVLTADAKKILCYSRNLEVATVFQKINIKTFFPIYYKMLKERFDTAIERRDLTEYAAHILSECLPIEASDHLIIEKILSYMTNCDLRKLCK